VSERPWETPDEEPEESEAWRGDVHLDDWPETLAGPEYWGGKGDGDLREKYPPKNELGEEDGG
jgi:hypothetical protein